MTFGASLAWHEAVALLGGAAATAFPGVPADLSGRLDADDAWVTPGVSAGVDTSPAGAAQLVREALYAKLRVFESLVRATARIATPTAVGSVDAVLGVLPAVDAAPIRWHVGIRFAATDAPAQPGAGVDAANARALGTLLARLLLVNDQRSASAVEAILQAAQRTAEARWTPAIRADDTAWIGHLFLTSSGIGPQAVLHDVGRRSLVDSDPVGADPWAGIWTIVVRLRSTLPGMGFGTGGVAGSPGGLWSVVLSELEPVVAQLRSIAFAPQVRAAELAAVTAAVVDPAERPMVDAMRIEVRAEHGGDVLQVEEFACRPGMSVSFGRAAGNDIVLPDETQKISKRHGRFDYQGEGRIVVVDTSLNGTVVDGRSIVTDAIELTGDADVHVSPYRLAVTRALVPDDSPATEGFVPDGTAERIVATLQRRHAECAARGAAARGAEMRALLERELNGVPDAVRAQVDRLVVELAGGEAGGVGCLDDLRAILRRLSPSAQLRNAEEVVAAIEILAKVADASIRWVHKALAGRSRFADEFGAEVTRVLRRDPNPLKGRDAADMLGYLLDRSAEADPVRLSHLQALYRDLLQHQIGLLAGAYEVIAEIAARIAPARVRNMPGDGIRSSWLGGAAARHWKVYEQLYDDLFAERTKLFDEVVLPALQRGYLVHHDTDHADPDESGGSGIEIHS